MNYTMKNISLFTCSVMASIVVLSACAQSTVTVRPTQSTSDTRTVRTTAPGKQYEPISLNEPYIVKAGDTLYGISFRAGLSYRDLAAWNNITEPYTVKIGQRILLRSSNNNKPADVVVASSVATTSVATTSVATTSVATTSVATTSVGKPAETKPVEIKPTIIKLPVIITVNPVETTVPMVASTVPAVVQIPNVITTPTAEIKPASNATTMSWRWPSDGRLIARYVQGDTTQQGINIGGKSGQPIQASADGTVVYSGAGLVGYGELIIIKHNAEWLSAYAHNRRRLVAEGTKVKAGDVIAEMGRTGTMRDMLHFEIRRNGKPVDPLLYLPKQ